MAAPAPVTVTSTVTSTSISTTPVPSTVILTTAVPSTATTSTTVSNTVIPSTTFTSTVVTSTVTASAPTTSTAPTLSPQPTTTSPAQNNGTVAHTASCQNLGRGAVAGISAGSAVAAALLAAIIVWLVMRVSSKRPGPSRFEEEPDSFSLEKRTGASTSNNLVAKETLVEEPSAAATIQDSLPQPEEDQAIAGETSRLRTLIKHHVQSYYHNAPLEASLMSATNANVASLANLAHGQLSTSRLNSLLLNPKTRLATIRSCLAWTMISRIQLTCRSDSSFLPPEVSSWMNTTSAVETRDQSKLLTVRVSIRTI